MVMEGKYDMSQDYDRNHLICRLKSWRGHEVDYFFGKKRYQEPHKEAHGAEISEYPGINPLITFLAEIFHPPRTPNLNERRGHKLIDQRSELISEGVQPGGSHIDILFHKVPVGGMNDIGGDIRGDKRHAKSNHLFHQSKIELEPHLA